MIQADILVVLATFNGRDRLARVLDGYINQIETNQTWKIVVADNGSVSGANSRVVQACAILTRVGRLGTGGAPGTARRSPR